MSDVKVSVTGGKAWEKTISRIGGAADMKLNVGILEGATYASDAEPKSPMPTVAQVAFWHEFGAGRNPERSFLRRGLEEHGQKWSREIQTLLVNRADALASDPRGTVRAALEVAGLGAADDCASYINKSMLTPLSPGRIAAKRRHGQTSNAAVPLAFTGALVEAVKSEVRDE